MKFFHAACVLAAILLLLSLPLVDVPVVSVVRDCETLRVYGISGLLDDFPEEPALKKTFRLDASKLTLKPSASGYEVAIDGVDGVTIETGKPSLPYKSMVFELPRNVEVTEVGVVNVAYEKLYISGKVEPALQPLPFTPNYERFVNLTEPPKEDSETYESTNFYPGTLTNWHMGKSRDRTYVFVQFYPVQYSPRHQLLLVITQADIVIAYRNVDATNENVQLVTVLGDVGTAEYVIITSPELEVAAKPMADFYSAKGINTAIVTTDWIYENYPPAENITMYPGFYTFTPWKPDPHYELLLQKYDWVLALKIVSFLRDEAAHPFLTHVLLLGPSDRVPPSFYYWSSENYWRIDMWNGWVPTDMFYASPDYDLVPNYAVGRIPVDNSEQAAHIISKIGSWYSSVSANPDWFRKAFFSGGYPFGYIFMHGESFVSNLLKKGYVRKLNADAVYRTDYTYNRSSVLNCLSGGYGWAFMIAHGSGDAMVDMLYDETRDTMTFEWLADTWDLMNLESNPTVPIIMSVACMNGAWDEEILPPTWFRPPSFGEASLLSPAGGIAYIGSSRVAWSMLFYNITQGVLDVEDPLACQYLASILKAYNESVSPSTLGEVVSNGLLDYLSKVGPYWYYLTTIMEFGLLGDPYLTLPVFDEPYKLEKIKAVEITNPVAQIPVESIAPFLYAWGAVEGTLPYVTASQLAIEFNVEASEATTVKVDITRVLGWFYGYYHERLAGYIARPSVETSVVEGFASGKVDLSFLTSGHLLLKVRSGQDEWRIYVISYGLSTSKPETPSGSSLTLAGPGLDVLGPPGTEAMIEFGGNFITYAVLEKFGLSECSLIVPWAEPGDYNITVYIPTAEWYRFMWWISPPPPLPAAFATQKVLLSGALATIQGNILYVNTTLGIITAKLEDIDVTVMDVRGNVAYVNTTLGEINLDVNELKGIINNAESAIITKIENGTATINLRIGSSTTEIKASVEALEPKITEVNDGVATVDTRIGTLQADVLTIKENTETVPEVLSATSTQIWVAIFLSLIAAIAAICLVIAIRRKKSS